MLPWSLPLILAILKTDRYSNHQHRTDVEGDLETNERRTSVPTRCSRCSPIAILVMMIMLVYVLLLMLLLRVVVIKTAREARGPEGPAR